MAEPPQLTHLRAQWRAAMRGRRLPVSQDMLYQLLASVPAQATQALVIFPEGSSYRCKWIGLTAEEAAEALYQCADMVVDQRLKPRPLRPK